MEPATTEAACEATCDLCGDEAVAVELHDTPEDQMPIDRPETEPAGHLCMECWRLLRQWERA